MSTLLDDAIAEALQEMYEMEKVAERVEAIAKTLVTEDDEPVDNLYCAKLQRLLVEILYASLLTLMRRLDPEGPHAFLADANVAVYPALHGRPLVPDVFLSVSVEVADWHETKEPRCYFVWEFGKPPDVAVEIVSNKTGNELGSKLRDYARARVPYYVVYDAWLNLGRIPVRVYELNGSGYRLRPDLQLPDMGLSVTLWRGEYDSTYGEWLRWADADGNLLPNKLELAAQEAARADQEAARADQEKTRADQAIAQAEQKAARMAAKLRELGLDPDAV